MTLKICCITRHKKKSYIVFFLFVFLAGASYDTEINKTIIFFFGRQYKFVYTVRAEEKKKDMEIKLSIGNQERLYSIFFSSTLENRQYLVFLFLIVICVIDEKEKSRKSEEWAWNETFLNISLPL